MICFIRNSSGIMELNEMEFWVRGSSAWLGGVDDLSRTLTTAGNNPFEGGLSARAIANMAWQGRTPAQVDFLNQPDRVEGIRYILQYGL